MVEWLDYARKCFLEGYKLRGMEARVLREAHRDGLARILEERDEGDELMEMKPQEEVFYDPETHSCPSSINQRVRSLKARAEEWDSSFFFWLGVQMYEIQHSHQMDYEAEVDRRGRLVLEDWSREDKDEGDCQPLM